MPNWVCPWCGHGVSSAFERNLELLVEDHRRFECPFKNVPKESLPLSLGDKEFLDKLKVGW